MIVLRLSAKVWIGGCKLDGEQSPTSDVPIGPIQASDQAQSDRIAASRECDWDRRSCSLGRVGRRLGASNDTRELKLLVAVVDAMAFSVSGHRRRQSGGRRTFDTDVLWGITFVIMKNATSFEPSSGSRRLTNAHWHVS
jgi:hypothetical protein